MSATAAFPTDAADSERLRTIIAARSLLRGGQFTLASGRQSSLFFDMKRSMLDPEGAGLIANAILDRIEPGEADSVGGLAMGAVPIVAVACAASFLAPRFAGRGLAGFFVRKEVKDHGTARRVEGNLEPGARAVILEDVTTTGGSAMQAVDAVRAAGADVVKVIAVVDRLEGAADVFRAAGLAFEAVFDRNDFSIE